MLRCAAVDTRRALWRGQDRREGRLRLAAAVLSGLLAAGCGGEPPSDPAVAPPPIFVDRAAQSGLDFVHFNGMSGELYLAEITCGGGALVDVDDDGDLDVYLPQGRMLGPGKTIADAPLPPRYPQPLTDRLYRNDLEVGADGSRRLRFTDVTATAGLDETTFYGCGVAVGDVDNDGRIDLYVTNLGPNRLLHNLGGGTFRDLTVESGTGDAGSSVPAAFFDFDRDGWLDLFVGNNVSFDYSGQAPCYSLAGAPDYCGPGAYPAEADRLYRNLGGGAAPRFADVTAGVGLGGVREPTLGAVTADFDGDGWIDVYVANDGRPNHLWLSRRGAGGRVRFVDEARLSGCAVNARGEAEASMGVAAGDYDGDGDLDLFLAHLIKETNTLYANVGGGVFDDVTLTSGLGPPSLPYTSFGTAWLDVDNDGHLDLLVANGAVTRLPELVRRGDPFPLHQPNQLFRNLGGGRFEDVSRAAGEALARSEVSRAAAFGDVDNDGDTDVLVVNNGGPVRLLINQVGQDRPWLGVRLVGGAGVGGRDMLGARAALLRPGRPTLWRRVGAEGSFCAAGDPRLLFGLGDDEIAAAARIRVVWPDGAIEEWPQVPAGRYTTLRQGSGQRAAAPRDVLDSPP